MAKLRASVKRSQLRNRMIRMRSSHLLSRTRTSMRECTAMRMPFVTVLQEFACESR